MRGVSGVVFLIRILKRWSDYTTDYSTVCVCVCVCVHSEVSALLVQREAGRVE